MSAGFDSIMFINNVSVDRKIPYDWSESKSGQQKEETEGDDITLVRIFIKKNCELKLREKLK